MYNNLIIGLIFFCALPAATKAQAVPQTCIISGPGEVCPNTTGLTFSGPADAGGWSWAITAGDASIAGSDSTQEVTVNAGSSSFVIELFLAEDSTSCNFQVDVYPLPSVEISSPNSFTLCEGDQLDLSVNTSLPASIEWSGPNGFISNAQSFTISNITNVVSGTYTVTIIDMNGCTNTSDVSFSVLENPVAEAEPDFISSCEDSIVTLTAYASGGTGPYTFFWTDGNAPPFSASPTVTFIPDESTIIYLTVVDAAGCMNIDSVGLALELNLSNYITEFDTLCFESSSLLLSPYTSEIPGNWSGPGVFFNTFDPNQANLGSNFLTFIPDPGQCAAVESIELIVELPEPSEPFYIPDISDWDANSEETDAEEWTNYFQLNCDTTDTDTILLSILKKGVDIGSVNDGTFKAQVFKNGGVTDITGWTRAYAPELGPIDTALALNYFWEVTPNYGTPGADTATFGLKFYFSQADVDTLSIAMGVPFDPEDLFFFKASHGAEPYPCGDFSLMTDLNVKVFANGPSPSTGEWKLDDFGVSSIVGTMDIVGFSCGGIFAIRHLTQVEEISGIEKLTLGPNPSAGEVNLRFRANKPENLHISIFSSLGNLVHQESLPVYPGIIQTSLFLQHMPAGMYLLRLQNEEGETMSRKFLLAP